MRLFRKSIAGDGKKSNWLLRWGWRVSLLALIGGGVLAVLIFYSAWAQTFEMKKVGQMPERNTVFDVDGKIYSRLAGANRLIVPLNEVSRSFIDALLVREDSRFFEHGGINFTAILRAALADIKAGHSAQGGSTITQQVAKSLMLTPEKKLSRKAVSTRPLSSGRRRLFSIRT